MSKLTRNLVSIFPLILLSSQALADAATTVASATIVAFGLGAAGTAGYYEGIVGHELPDWKRSETDSTAKLESQCSLVSEFHLVGANRINGILLTVHNKSQETWVIKPSEITVVFASGRERAAEYFVPDVGDTVLQPNWKGVGFVPLPSKSDFKDQNSLVVRVPIYKASSTSEKPECTVEAHMERDPNIPHLERTGISVTSFEMDLGFGLSLFRSNDLPALGWKQAPSTILGIFVYPGINDGFGIDLAIEGFGGGDPNVLFQPTGGVTSGVGLTSEFYALDYSHRFFFSEPSALTLDIGLGGNSYSYNNIGGGRSYSSNFAIVGRISYDYRFARVYSGFWIGDYFLGVTIYDNYVPVGTIGQVGATGHSVGSLLRFKLGI